MLRIFFFILVVGGVVPSWAGCPAKKPDVDGAYACKMKQSFALDGSSTETATYCCYNGATPVGEATITCNGATWAKPAFKCPGAAGPSQPGNKPAVQPGEPVQPSKSDGSKTQGFSVNPSGEIWMPSKGDQTACGMSKGPYAPLTVPSKGGQCKNGVTGPPTRCKGDVAKEVYPLSKGEILDRHNCWRSKVTPPAKNMPKLQWDDDLQLIAERWAAQCPTGHDEFEDRALPHRKGSNGQTWEMVGQNLCGASYNRTFVDCVDDWAAEQVNYKYGVGSVNGRVTGHYTQLISDRSTHVGCGSSYCPQQSGFWKFVQICNYALAGNYNGGEKVPYVKA